MTKGFIINSQFRSLNDAINAGSFNECDPRINLRNFPMDDLQVNATLHLYALRTEMTTPKIVQLIDGLKQRRATTLLELCAFSANQPEAQWPFHIIATGTTMETSEKHLLIPFIDSCFPDEKNLALGDSYSPWQAGSRILLAEC